jgi:hypothetical protein
LRQSTAAPTALGTVCLAKKISTTILIGLICVAFGLWLGHWQARHAQGAS